MARRASGGGDGGGCAGALDLGGAGQCAGRRPADLDRDPDGLGAAMRLRAMARPMAGPSASCSRAGRRRARWRDDGRDDDRGGGGAERRLGHDHGRGGDGASTSTATSYAYAQTAADLGQDVIRITNHGRRRPAHPAWHHGQRASGRCGARLQRPDRCDRPHASSASAPASTRRAGWMRPTTS